MDKTLQYYQKNKKNLTIPLVCSILSFALIFFVIIPQTSSVGEVSQSVEAQQQKISMLKSSLTTLQSQNEAQVDTDFELVSNALPNGKNIISIFSALSGAASVAQVGITGFSFDVGSLYEQGAENGQTTDIPKTQVSGVPMLTVSLEAFSDSKENLLQFSKVLSEQFPLAEISTLNIRDDTGSYSINFFYKPYNLDQIMNKEEVTNLDSASKNTLDTLKSW